MIRTKKILAILLCLLCLASLAAPAGAAANSGIRNVIFMIGDGMGYNHLKLAEEEGYDIFMDDAPDLFGWSRTRSASDEVTDSAAGATALSCGLRTNNQMLSVFPEKEKRQFLRPRTITENAILHGMKAGVVTTDKTTGATPSAYSAHTNSRNNTDTIVAQQLEGRLRLIFGAKESAAAQEAVEAAGFSYVETRAQLEALTAGSRAYGQFGSDLWKIDLPETEPSLTQMSKKAISLLSAKNSKGFFLMIEGAHIDKLADDSENGAVDYPEKRANTAQAVKTFDDAVRYAVKFARADGHTLVIITADHETGDLRAEADTGRMTFHSASHTAANVPIFVYGADDLFKDGAELDNCDIANLIAKKLGWIERFPITDPVLTPEEENTIWSRIGGFFRNVWNTIGTFFENVFNWISNLFK